MKFAGAIGFWQDDVEVKPGVYVPGITERPNYIGDILKNYRSFKNDSQNETFTVNNRISILSDIFLQQNWSSVRYVVWNDQKIKVTGVTVDFPRVILELGGVWNGETEDRTSFNTDEYPEFG